MKKNLLKNAAVQSLIASLLCIVLGLLLGFIVLLFIATAVNAWVEANCVTASAQWTEALLSKF